MKKCFILMFVLLVLSVNTYAERDIVITIPKSGTNLLMKCIKMIKAKYDDNEGIQWHHHWRINPNDPVSLGPTALKVETIERNRQNVVLIVRDPRDLICALARVANGNMSSDNLNDIILFNGRYLSMITNKTAFFLKFDSLFSVYQEYLEWSQYPFVYITYFEKLIGPRGGGSREEQIQEILNIANHIGKPLTRQEALGIANNLFGGTPTFKQGKVKDWKVRFSKENLLNFQRINGGLIEFLGYED